MSSLHSNCAGTHKLAPHSPRPPLQPPPPPLSSFRKSWGSWLPPTLTWPLSPLRSCCANSHIPVTPSTVAAPAPELVSQIVAAPDIDMAAEPSEASAAVEGLDIPAMPAINADTNVKVCISCGLSVGYRGW